MLPQPACWLCIKKLQRCCPLRAPTHTPGLLLLPPLPRLLLPAQPFVAAALAPPLPPSCAPLLAYDDALARHAPPTGSGHPERPQRAVAVMARLAATGLAARCRRVRCGCMYACMRARRVRSCRRAPATLHKAPNCCHCCVALQVPCRPALRAELALVHDAALIDEVAAASRLAAAEAAAADAAGRHMRPAGALLPAVVSHGVELGAEHIADCYVGAATYEAAAAAAGGAADVAAAVARGEAPGGAAIIRPPGHHSEGGLAMGFCLFNNAAVAARAAQAAGAARVLILVRRASLPLPGWLKAAVLACSICACGLRQC